MFLGIYIYLMTRVDWLIDPRKRQGYLEDCHAFYQLVQDLEEEGQWVDDKLAICTATIQAKGTVSNRNIPWDLILGLGFGLGRNFGYIIICIF